MTNTNCTLRRPKKRRMSAGYNPTPKDQRKAGRPTNGSIGKPLRQITVGIRLTPEEYDTLIGHCKAVHYSVSELVRQMIVAVLPKREQA